MNTFKMEHSVKVKVHKELKVEVLLDNWQNLDLILPSAGQKWLLHNLISFLSFPPPLLQFFSDVCPFKTEEICAHFKIVLM